jgi:hypothetical protein
VYINVYIYIHIFPALSSEKAWKGSSDTLMASHVHTLILSVISRSFSQLKGNQNLFGEMADSRSETEKVKGELVHCI